MMTTFWLRLKRDSNSCCTTASTKADCFHYCLLLSCNTELCAGDSNRLWAHSRPNLCANDAVKRGVTRGSTTVRTKCPREETRVNERRQEGVDGRQEDRGVVVGLGGRRCWHPARTAGANTKSGMAMMACQACLTNTGSGGAGHGEGLQAVLLKSAACTE